MDERLSTALWQALSVTTVVVVAIKWWTGVAFLPLLLLALVILAMAFGMAIRLQRGTRRPE